MTKTLRIDDGPTLMSDEDLDAVAGGIPSIWPPPPDLPDQASDRAPDDTGPKTTPPPFRVP